MSKASQHASSLLRACRTRRRAEVDQALRSYEQARKLTTFRSDAREEESLDLLDGVVDRIREQVHSDKPVSLTGAAGLAIFELLTQLTRPIRLARPTPAADATDSRSS
jgi:hypothetical protein